jgi:hypothetical protein
MAEAFWCDILDVFGDDMQRLRMTVGCLKEFQLKLHSEQSSAARTELPMTPEGEVDTDAQELEQVMAQASAKGDG